MELQRKFVLGLALVSLFGTVTNFVYFSPLLTLLVPLALFALNKDEIQRPVAWLYAFVLLFLTGVLLYHPLSLVEFGFYRRDGNFVISYAPLLILPLFSFKFKIQRYFRHFYLFVVALYGLLFLYHLLTANIFGGLREVVFGGLFYAQNAVGGFLSIVGSLGFAYWYHRRGKKEGFYFLLLFVILLATYSRGSILGLVLGIAGWYCTVTDRFKTLVLLLLVPVLFTVGSLMIGYPFYQGQLAVSNNVEVELDEEIGTKNANVLIRLFYAFPRAYYLFQQSPVLGTGVGSYDDQPFDFREIVPYVQYNAQPNKAHTDAHAHHSYLQLLAEQGIVGLLLFLTFWGSLFLYLKNIRDLPVLRDYLLIAFFTITFASFTEHRITAPAMMLPFTISLGMLFMHQETIKRVKIREL
ncbi:O-antigen ligase family protein [Fodinibius sediminis]|uniref:O-antigen ligase n=1 Tax=Fodinibius sediminis TaxID=1214077 RepID=A0A521BUR0_9BACT|nr:O-antigen ligase family protein [Fodinibius sediminis]SMO50924.1 O-antigen ligase [Fodinibius sediminis]